MGSLDQREFFNIVNDERRGSSVTHRVTDPRTEEDLWECPVASTQDLEDAIDAANKAFPAWSKTTLAERQALLVKIADRIKEHAAELTELVMRETGKSALMGAIEINNTVEQTLYYSKVGLEDEVQFEDESIKIIATHMPLGVVGAICPWNFPIILSNIKIASSIVTGNCVIIKPSPFTPYSVLRSVEVCLGVLPRGVLQVVNGGADLGALMTQHPGIHKISFTGTIATGKRVMAACAQTLKKVTLELAGNNAAIVCPDVDIPHAVAQTAAGSFFNAGQMCVATKRIYVHRDIYEPFVKTFCEEASNAYVIKDDPQEMSLFGPVANKMQFDIVKNILEDAKKAGGKVLAGGKVRDGKGFWIEPTVVAEPPEDSLLVQEEQFGAFSSHHMSEKSRHQDKSSLTNFPNLGPIVPILSWSEEDDVISRANLDNSGLGATVYSQDLSRAERIARRLEAGTVWINMSEKPNPGAWFSGQKNSGFGGEMGKQGLLSYSYTKSIHYPKGK